MKTTRYVVILLVIAMVVVGGFYLFKKQPKTNIPIGWLTFTDEARVYSFNYPKDFGSDYITPLDWPPQVDLLDGPTFDCPTASSPTAHAGQTNQVTVDGQKYCVTTQTEGAAGSTYTDYAYLTIVDGQIVRLTFTLREPQCLNYDEPKQSECQQDQTSLNLNHLIGQIIASWQFTPNP